ncbi:hypothetical protein Syun_009264 [Stephania yunnanensis]|uniref:NAC domain-containing protein n=1 Tax=Stephania yunnanensis TaxID=152371 RepID=A0AAP0PQQ5_9MAGN
MVDMEKLSSCLDCGKDDDIILPGFRFHPTDEELVGFYLRRKVERKPLSIELIKHIDIYKYDPWDLPKVSTAGDKEWYFFCIRERKYRNSIRPNRVTGSGFWKATGIDRPVYSISEPHDCIGLKKSLVYYRGSAGKGTKTDWMMHEFRLPPSEGKTSKPSSNLKNNIAVEAEIWTLCRIFKRNVSHKKAFLPNLRTSGTTSSMKQNLAHHVSRASQNYSFESVNLDKYNSFGSSNTCVQQREKKPGVVVNHIDEKMHILPDQLSSISTHPPAPIATIFHANFSSLSSNIELFRDGNWDELGRMLEFSSDSAFLYDCK